MVLSPSVQKGDCQAAQAQAERQWGAPAKSPVADRLGMQAA